jgi:NADH dehydrogenase/NADH:ubiquinone oxidoreductase subunit G
VTLTIEGRQVHVPAGTSILEAAKTAGILVPHYCYHPALPIPALCRMCLVEVEKAPKLLPACQTTVADNQVVHVHSSKAQEARKGVLEMLLINHPLDCPICDQSGECELQDYTYAEGRADSRYKEPKRFNPVEDFGGDVMYVANRCILCTRCVRVCAEIEGAHIWDVMGRGIDSLVITDLNQPWGESGCTRCGKCVQVCPTGALFDKGKVGANHPKYPDFLPYLNMMREAQ